LSTFKHLTTSIIEFDSGYSVEFSPVVGLGSVFCALRYRGEVEPVTKFMSKPGKGDGFYGYLSPEDFAEVLFRVSSGKRNES
jgi:hypothetical protein